MPNGTEAVFYRKRMEKGVELNEPVSIGEVLAALGTRLDEEDALTNESETDFEKIAKGETL